VLSFTPLNIFTITGSLADTPQTLFHVFYAISRLCDQAPEVQAPAGPGIPDPVNKGKN
jgi:hypothetical protein